MREGYLIGQILRTGMMPLLATVRIMSLPKQNLAGNLFHEHICLISQIDYVE
jgi:hypothetical protein